MNRKVTRPKGNNEFEDAVIGAIPQLRRYARSLLRDSDRSEDLVQDTLARCLSKRHLWQPGTDLRAWMFRVMHSRYVDLVRSSVRHGPRVGVTDFLMNNNPALHCAAVQNTTLMMRDLSRAMAAIPKKQRVTIELVALECMNYDEVAELLDVPVGTVRSRLSRGREALRELLGLDRRDLCELRSRPRRQSVHDIRQQAAGAAVSRSLPERPQGIDHGEAPTLTACTADSPAQSALVV